MSDVEYLINGKVGLEQFSKGYLGKISKLLEQLDVSKIKEFVEELEKARKNQNTVFFVGNGGSAATASHMVNDLGIGARTNTGSSIKVLALTNNVSVMTAIANDNGYNNIFLNQIQVHYRPGDKLVVISASGNSSNVVAVAEWVKKKGGVVIGLLGFDGGRLKEISDIPIIVKTEKGEYGPVEDIHMIIGHLIHAWLRYGNRLGENK